MELIASAVVGVLVAGIAGGFSLSGALYGAGSFLAILILAFVIHLLLSPSDLDKQNQTEIDRLSGIVWQLTRNKVIFKVSTFIRNSTVLLTDPGDTDDWRDAVVYHLEAKLFIRFYNDEPEPVLVNGFSLSIINDATSKEWPLTLHIIPPNFRRPNAQENEYFQGLVAGGKEMTDWYFFEYWMDVPKDCALSLDKNCYLRVSLDAGKREAYFVDLLVPWRAARQRAVDVHNRNRDTEIECL